MRKLTCTLLVLAAVAAAPQTETAHLKITATLNDLAAITHAIGGEHVTVDCLAPPTVDPHYVDPRPSLIRMGNLRTGGEGEEEEFTVRKAAAWVAGVSAEKEHK